MQYQGFTEVQAVANASVPIVKMVDGRGSGLHVDICFNNMLGVANTRFANISAQQLRLLYIAVLASDYLAAVTWSSTQLAGF